MTSSFDQRLTELLPHESTRIDGKARLLVELVAVQFAKHRSIVLVTKNAAAFSDRLKNLRFFAKDQGQTIKTLPADERTVMHATSADPLVRAEKVATRFALAIDEHPSILLVSPEGLLERCPNAFDLQKHAQVLVKGETLNRDRLINALVLMGYAKVNHVLDRNTFAVRGSIIDIFVNGAKRPVRLDLFGDEIESLRYFDESTQRGLEPIPSIIVGGAKEIFLDDETLPRAEEKLRNLGDMLNYPTHKLNEKLRDIENQVHFYGMEKLLPAFFSNLSSLLELLASSKPKPLVIFDDRDAIFAEMRGFLEHIDELYQQACLRGDLTFSRDDHFLTVDAVTTLLKGFPTIDISAYQSGTVSLASRETSDLRQDILQASVSVTKDEEPHLLKPLADRIKRLHREQIATVVTVSSREHEQELKRLLEPMGINTAHLAALPGIEAARASLYRSHVQAYTLIAKDALAFGGVFDFLGLALIAEEDIFGKRTKRRDTSGKQKGFGTAVSDLEPNDYVVHVDFGVGQFKGLVRLNVRGVDNDYILLHYANDEKLYLPIHRINLIKPHSRLGEATPRLDKLGGTQWASKKSKVKEAVMAMAQDLLKLYAKRELVERKPFIEPDAHFLEFEANFEFETTHDQQKAIDDVLRDMQKKRPMDRLVCGDVGYGKTEVAMRAAMLSVLSKRQVAILAPTTVLAQQHGITFTERFKNTGATVAVLSRFQKKQEVSGILDKLRKNQVDVVIGTHRLLSPDVIFHDLGLIVVDEEQRFGIKAKEHLKKMRTKVDVLTMSATPIPRTMQMSYFGIRDLSIIETPPVDRLAIETHVAQFDDAMIKEAINREIRRGGQVYFVHNRVQSIEATAEYLRMLVPEARIETAHGQMGEDDLERIMLRFMAHEINVLVCTTIIETGIDVPTANTMFINDADDFGLSQLYQLRGRIGRSKERAFCFLLIKKQTEHLTPIARTRLEILHKFSDLGVGFRIAQHDLELRGAGDLLGKNQHGHMATVGYDLYAELLHEAVRELQGQTDLDDVDPEVILPMSALISEKYCPDMHERMGFYQRLASADSREKIDSIIYDLEELYGEAPPEVLALKASALIKLELKRIRALKLELSQNKDTQALSVSISLSEKSPIDHKKLEAVMKEGLALRVTPQHKVIQLLNVSSALDPDLAYKSATVAITNVERHLMKDI